VTGSLFDAVYEARDVFVGMVMIDAAEMHCLVAARADDTIAMHNAPNTLAECRATFLAPHTDFHVVDGVVHDTGPAQREYDARS
jgi:hypothetical protein